VRSVPSFPHRAFVVTLSVEDGDETDVRVDGEITTVVELVLTLLTEDDFGFCTQSPKPVWQPFPQYASVLPLLLSVTSQTTLASVLLTSKNIANSNLHTHFLCMSVHQSHARIVLMY
jgi:hypothetical protein